MGNVVTTGREGEMGSDVGSNFDLHVLYAGEWKAYLQSGVEGIQENQ
jgi:hypothetical protein